jgi:hypothetical protein
MNIYKTFATLFFVMVLVTGCASTGGDQKAADIPSGSILINEWQVLAIGEVQWGQGTLNYNGQLHKFKIKGVGAGGVGVHKLAVTGNTYHLNNIADFPGTYVEGRAGITVVKGVGGLWVKNTKGVTLHLKTHTEGAALALGVDGLKIEMQ